MKHESYSYGDVEILTSQFNVMKYLSLEEHVNPVH